MGKQIQTGYPTLPDGLVVPRRTPNPIQSDLTPALIHLM